MIFFVARSFSVSDRSGCLLGLKTTSSIEPGSFWTRWISCGVRDLLGRLRLRDQRLARQVDEQHDHDQREERATEEAIHGFSVPQGSRARFFGPPRPGVLYALRGSAPRSAPPRRGGCGTARRSRARSRSRTGSGSRSRSSGPARRSRGAPASSAARRSRATPARATRGSASGRRASGPESMMSSTTSTWRPSMLMSRSLRMRTTPEESVCGAVARDRHEVDLARDGQVAHQVGHEEDGALEDADQQQVAARVVGGDLLAELGDARAQRSRRRSGSRRPPAPAPSSSRFASPVTSCILHDPGHGDNLFVADDERPGVALGPRAPSRRRRRPGASCGARRAGRRAGARAPRGRARRDSIVHGPPADGALLERDPVVLAHRRTPLPRSADFEPSRGREQLEQRVLHRAGQPRALVGEAERGSARPPGGAAAAAAASSSRIRPRSVSGFEESVRNSSPLRAAVGLGLLAPERRAAGGRRRPRAAA